MPDESILRDQARRAVEQRKLPNRQPDRLSGGPGVGAPCAVCDRPVEKADMEFEIQFARDGGAPHFDRFHVHTRCYAAWEFVRHDRVGSGGPPLPLGRWLAVPQGTSAREPGVLPRKPTPPDHPTLDEQGAIVEAGPPPRAISPRMLAVLQKVDTADAEHLAGLRASADRDAERVRAEKAAPKRPPLRLH